VKLNKKIFPLRGVTKNIYIYIYIYIHGICNLKGFYFGGGHWRRVLPDEWGRGKLTQVSRPAVTHVCIVPFDWGLGGGGGGGVGETVLGC